MGDRRIVEAFSSPRPTPQFYIQERTFSTKKERKSSTPRERDVPLLRPPTPVKSCPPMSRIFPWRSVLNNHAQIVSFRPSENASLSPIYNENSNDSYFEQMFEDPEPIGSGSFGEVFKVKSCEDGKYYAVKKSKDRFKGQYDRKRKMEEVAKHETLPPHSNCVQFVKAWEERGHLYIQTELCKMSVSQLCEENHSIAETVIWNYMVDLLMALKHLHDHNLVHMDIKPENAFVSFDDVCKLGDFGLVIDLTKKQDLSDAMEGDPKYLAPELMNGKFGKPADIFSLGVFCLEMACDLDIPRGGEGWHMIRDGQVPEHMMSGRSLDLKNVLAMMLDRNYEKRPTVDQCMAIPCIKKLLKSRMKRLMYRGALRRLRSNAPSPPTFSQSKATPPKPNNSNGTPKPPTENGSDKHNGANESFNDDDCGRLVGARGVNPDLNLSDEFQLPRNPAPRRAFTTPALRRRPAAFANNSSPIKRLLFASDVSGSSSGSPVSSRSANPNAASASADSTGSPILSPVQNNANGKEVLHRSGTPPLCSVIGMDCDQPKLNIEPKNLLGMFEAASDEDEDM